MTLATSLRRSTYTGNGANTVWEFPFRVDEASHLKVSTTVIATGVVTTQPSSAYSVVGIGEDDGGEVTFPLSGSPLDSSTTITVEREVPYTQDQHISNQSGFLPSVNERAFDRLEMQIQQMLDRIKDSEALIAVLNSGVPTTPPDLPVPVASAFGTIFANGVTDNTSVIQAAVDWMLTNAAKVYLPHGQFKLTTSVKRFKDVEFFGPGIFVADGNLWPVTPKESDTVQLFVSPTGNDTNNDGLSAARPLLTAQLAADAFIDRPMEARRGTAKVVCAAGNYLDQKIAIDDHRSFGGDLYIVGPDVSVNNGTFIELNHAPTAIFDGTNLGDVAGISINGSTTIHVENIAFQHFRNCCLQEFAQSKVFLMNMWGTGGQYILYSRGHSDIDIIAGTFTADTDVLSPYYTQFSWQNLFGVVWNTKASLRIENGPVFKFGAIAMHVKELDTGHIDFTSFLDGQVAIMASRCGTFNASSCRFWRNSGTSAVIILYNASFFGGMNTADFGIGTANANTNTNGLFEFDATSGVMINEQDTPANADGGIGVNNRTMRSMLTYTGNDTFYTETVETIYNGLNSLPAGSYVKAGTEVYLRVRGRKAGTAGRTRLRLNNAATILQEVSIAADATRYVAHIFLRSRGPTSQRCSGYVEHNGTPSDADWGAITNNVLPLEGAAETPLSLRYLNVLGDSISFDAIDPSTNERLNAEFA